MFAIYAIILTMIPQNYNIIVKTAVFADKVAEKISFIAKLVKHASLY
jgi:hypothetical protein